MRSIDNTFALLDQRAAALPTLSRCLYVPFFEDQATTMPTFWMTSLLRSSFQVLSALADIRCSLLRALLTLLCRYNRLAYFSSIVRHF